MRPTASTTPPEPTIPPESSPHTPIAAALTRFDGAAAAPDSAVPAGIVIFDGYAPGHPIIVTTHHRGSVVFCFRRNYASVDYVWPLPAGRGCLAVEPVQAGGLVMPHCFVLQPNGKFAIWSTIVDTFRYLDCTKEEAVDLEMVAPFNDGYPGGPNALRSDLLREFDNIQQTGVAWPWAPTWDAAIRTIYHFHGAASDAIAACAALGIETTPPPLCGLCKKKYQNVPCGQCRVVVCDECANEDQTRCINCVTTNC